MIIDRKYYSSNYKPDIIPMSFFNIMNSPHVVMDFQNRLRCFSNQILQTYEAIFECVIFQRHE